MFNRARATPSTQATEGGGGISSGSRSFSTTSADSLDTTTTGGASTPECGADAQRDARTPPSPGGSATWDIVHDGSSPTGSPKVGARRRESNSEGSLVSLLGSHDSLDDEVDAEKWDMLSLSEFSSRASSPIGGATPTLAAVPSVGDVAALAAASAMMTVREVAVPPP